MSVNGLAAFGLAVLAFAGPWPLPFNTLGGPFMLTQVVLLLPTALQSLRATVDFRRETKVAAYRWPCSKG